MREYHIGCSNHTVLVCSCKERVIVLGQIEDWYKEEKRFEFTCWCGNTLSFADSLPDELDTLKTSAYRE
jgi:hypothetical protein